MLVLATPINTDKPTASKNVLARPQTAGPSCPSQGTRRDRPDIGERRQQENTQVSAKRY